ncbi:hypothetical protein NHX12_001936 [Muraenolepis orangiensis]|uniref:Uncharacterized protein n=1 Tax=Muraenolepis orangiensis TaxID=630683 RepID=A0A9Q0E333_9TELE|nr:hypothetical protein NHX12_001936 [Muraenolepis orangiensis]
MRCSRQRKLAVSRQCELNNNVTQQQQQRRQRDRNANKGKVESMIFNTRLPGNSIFPRTARGCSHPSGSYRCSSRNKGGVEASGGTQVVPDGGKPRWSYLTETACLQYQVAAVRMWTHSWRHQARPPHNRWVSSAATSPGGPAGHLHPPAVWRHSDRSEARFRRIAMNVDKCST